jgi:hypothetical protein
LDQVVGPDAGDPARGEKKVVKPIPMSGFYSFSLGVLALGAGCLLSAWGCTQRLAIPAMITWYPPAVQNLSGMNLAVFPGRTTLIPPSFLAVRFPGRPFSVGSAYGRPVTDAASAPADISRRRQGGFNHLLSGENEEEATSGKFVSAMEGSSQLSLGGYISRTF